MGKQQTCFWFCSALEHRGKGHSVLFRALPSRLCIGHGSTLAYSKRGRCVHVRRLCKDIIAHLVAKLPPLLLLLLVVVVLVLDVVEETGRGAARWMEGRVAGILDKVARAHVVWPVL